MSFLFVCDEIYTNRNDQNEGDIMKREDILSYIFNNNGMINTEEAKELHINLRKLQRLEGEGELERVAQGLYLHKDFLVDPFYLAQYRSSKAIKKLVKKQRIIIFSKELFWKKFIGWRKGRI